MPQSLEALLDDVRACTLCADQLSHGVRPVLQASQSARILIAGQAPGAKVHASGIPFDDPSGDRLRAWLNVDRDTFYDGARIALIPMGFCYPGRGKSGDLPPIPICAQTWRERVLAALPNIKLTLLVGQYAQRWHLPEVKENLTETVRAWRDYGEHTLPLPHPSPRNNLWIRKNPWFEDQVLPALQKRVAVALAD